MTKQRLCVSFSTSGLLIILGVRIVFVSENFALLTSFHVVNMLVVFQMPYLQKKFIARFANELYRARACMESITENFLSHIFSSEAFLRLAF